jgi:histone H1/5
VSEKYNLDASAARNTHLLNNAISSGVEDNVFVQPKGPSGKVKLAPKESAATKDKEVSVLHVCPTIH